MAKRKRVCASHVSSGAHMSAVIHGSCISRCRFKCNLGTPTPRSEPCSRPTKTFIHPSSPRKGDRREKTKNSEIGSQSRATPSCDWRDSEETASGSRWCGGSSHADVSTHFSPDCTDSLYTSQPFLPFSIAAGVFFVYRVYQWQHCLFRARTLFTLK